jgi:hypothetical protein
MSGTSTKPSREDIVVDDRRGIGYSSQDRFGRKEADGARDCLAYASLK